MSRQDRFEGLTVETAIAQIKKKPLEALDAVDFAFLRARESYLSAEDKATYLKKTSKVVAEKPTEDVEGEVTDETTEDTTTDEVVADVKPLSKMNKDELIAKATELGLTFESTDTNKMLVEKITLAQAE